MFKFKLSFSDYPKPFQATLPKKLEFSNPVHVNDELRLLNTDGDAQYFTVRKVRHEQVSITKKGVAKIVTCLYL